MTRRFALIATATVLFSGCGLHGRSAARKKPATHAAPVETKTEPAPSGRIIAPGVVEPWGGEVAVAPRETGWIAAIPVVEGQHVEAGQLLAALDDEAQRAALSAARAEVGEAEAALARTLAGATAEERRLARAESAAASARAALATSEADRTTRLGARGAAAPAETERARREAEIQTALAEAAAARREQVDRGARSEDREAARARVAGARGRLAVAAAALERRRVVAPIAGTVLASRFHAGELAPTAGPPLFVLGDLVRLQVRLEVDEIDAARISVGGECKLVTDDGARVGSGSVVRVAPRMGRRGVPTEAPTSRADVRVREVWVEVAPGGALIPGRRVWGHLDPGVSVAAALEPGR